MKNQLGTNENLAARFFVTGLQPGPAQPNPARFAQKEASPAQPSPLPKMASPTIPALSQPGGLKTNRKAQEHPIFDLYLCQTSWLTQDEMID